jgi:hypothetical protein
MQINTDLGVTDTQRDAKRIVFQPVAPLTATNVEDAINQVQTNVTVAGTQPPNITATTVNFAQSPYAVQPTDYILEVDTTGGVVVITPQAVGTRTTPLEIKDISGNASVNNIQVTGPIDGLNPYLINMDYDAITIRPNRGKTAYEAVKW